jgi:hypothetical protein
MPVTFDDIAALNRERMTALGIHPRVRTMEFSLMQLMSAVGELATLAYRSTALSQFEQEEVCGIVGNLAISVATLGESFRVNVGEAAMERLQSQMTRTTSNANVAAVPSNNNNSSSNNYNSSRPENVATLNGSGRSPSTRRPASSPMVVETPPGPPQRAASASPPSVNNLVDSYQILSPTSRDSFFPNLDKIVHYPKEQFETLGLTWIVPRHDGKLVELIPNGYYVPVKYEQLSEYLARVRPFRQSPANVGAAVYPSPVARTPLPLPHHATTVSSNNNTTDAVGSLFSPHHFDHGLFSPYVGPQDGPHLSAEEEPSLPRSSAFSPTPYDEFLETFAKIESGAIAGAKIGLLRLKFVVPTLDGRQVELVPGGSRMPVTDANAEEFVRLVQTRLSQKESAVAGGSAPYSAATKPQPSSDRARRTDSIKRLEVSNAAGYDLVADGSKFSPTHFERDMFAPFANRTQFVVDYDHAEDILPMALRQPSPSPQPTQQPSSAPPQSLFPAPHPKQAEPPRTRVESASTPSYTQYIANHGVSGFRSIIHEVERNHEALKRFGVTYCIPASLTGVKGDDPIVDLFPDGRNTAVKPSEAHIFLGLARPYL